MNETLNILANRKSIRSYDAREISQQTKDIILEAAMRAPTAGNMMLYSIIEVTKQETKEKLAVTCDKQPFIAKAPWVLVFLADYQRWYDYFNVCGIEKYHAAKNDRMRTPEEGELFLACCDALIAAQNAVIAAESLGVGSCYIGDIMENYEIHKELFGLPEYVFPITMLCLGYPTPQQKSRPLSTRYDRSFIVFKDTYQHHDIKDFDRMFAHRHRQIFGKQTDIKGATNVGQHMYQKKYTSQFQAEMNRSVRLILKSWFGDKPG